MLIFQPSITENWPEGTLFNTLNMSEEDEESLLHVVSAIEAKNKLKALMADIK